MNIVILLTLIIAAVALLIAWGVDGRFRVGLTVGGIVLLAGVLINWAMTALGAV